MQAGYGVLGLTTKGTSPSDVELLCGMAREADRDNSVVMVGPSHGLGFNLLRYEMTASHRANATGDLASNVAALFSAAAELALPRRDGKHGEQIWRQAVESLVRHSVTIVFGATGDLRLDEIVEVVRSAPQSAAQLKDASWRRESLCIQLLDRAIQRKPTNRNLGLARDYFLSEFPSYPPDTKNSVLFTFGAGCADLFLRDPLHSMFFGATDYTPEILLEGAILVVDCPVLEYREVGKVANGLLRICTQRVLERRACHPSKRPVAIIWDEAQKTLLPSDVAFQDTARSAMCATVAAVQHIPAIRDAVGPELAATFLGNLRSKVFFQSNEPETGDYMRRLCGSKEVKQATQNYGSGGQKGSSETPVTKDALPAHATHNLKTGGEDNRHKVTGFLIVGSKRMRHGEPYQKIAINQKQIGRSWWLFSRRLQVAARARPAPDFRYLRAQG
jgi:type IV secretory pathway TraG/TraD family ATPase VirD4